MERFVKEVSNVLPYDREQYLDFFDEDVDLPNPTPRWFGVSLQLASIQNQKLSVSTNEIIEHSIDLLLLALKTIVSMLDKSRFWIVNHDDKDMEWFPVGKNGEMVPELKAFFQQNNVPNSYRGSLVFSKDDLLLIGRDLVSYPYRFSYKNLDISHSELQFVIKITGHLTIDLLSTNQTLIHQIMNDGSLSTFVKINYRSRWSDNK